jgi:hypothetical protein
LRQAKLFDLAVLQGDLLCYLELFLDSPLTVLNDLRDGFLYLGVYQVNVLALQVFCTLYHRKHGYNRH